jgi:copper(I)-binding protein
MHETSMEGDVMKMQQVTSIPIAGKESIEFAPGGLHIMLIGLNEDLQAGDEIQVILHFTEHEDIRLTVPVQEMEGEGSMNEH